MCDLLYQWFGWCIRSGENGTPNAAHEMRQDEFAREKKPHQLHANIKRTQA